MTNDHTPTATLEMLRQRAEVVRALRRFFDERKFFEVETPILSHDIVVDRYLHPVAIAKKALTGSASDRDEKLWMQTSPEFGMKRIVAAGAEAIYQIGKCFRQSESGRMHNPEFTMLEWYRIGDDMHSAMGFLGELVEKILSRPKTQFVSYREVFKQHAKIDPFTCAVKDLKQVAADANVAIEMPADEQRRDDWLNLVLSTLVEPHLGIGRPVMVYDWPASQAALAIVRDGDPPLAERFELYVDGIELANGYHELLDAEELSRRNSINNQKRVKDGVQLLPEESRLLDAMRSGMPECAGVALGVDRLVMLAVGASSIDEVLTFPIDRA